MRKKRNKSEETDRITGAPVTLICVLCALRTQISRSICNFTPYSLSARLMQHACKQKGSMPIVVDAATEYAAKVALSLTSRGVIKVKGKVKPVRIYSYEPPMLSESAVAAAIAGEIGCEY
jgi:hypothetical protein